MGLTESMLLSPTYDLRAFKHNLSRTKRTILLHVKVGHRDDSYITKEEQLYIIDSPSIYIAIFVVVQLQSMHAIPSMIYLVLKFLCPNRDSIMEIIGEQIESSYNCSLKKTKKSQPHNMDKKNSRSNKCSLILPLLNIRTVEKPNVLNIGPTLRALNEEI